LVDWVFAKQIAQRARAFSLENQLTSKAGSAEFSLENSVDN